MQEQNFKNHVRLVPWFHYFTFSLVAVAFGGSIVKLVRSYQTGLTGLLVPIILLALSVALLMGLFFARLFALKAQDRAIRAEENLRHFAMTGKLLDSRLKTYQVVALRFASDEEFVALAAKAAAENMAPKEIKLAIQKWKGDYHRV